MKYIFSFLIILFITTFSYSQSVKLLDHENGFRNFKLGTDFKSYKNLVLINEDKRGFKYYKLENESYLYYDITLKSITYCFFENMLYAVILEINNFIDVDITKEKLLELYGKPDITLFAINESTWLGEKATLRFVPDINAGTARITISAKSIFDKK